MVTHMQRCPKMSKFVTRTVGFINNNAEKPGVKLKCPLGVWNKTGSKGYEIISTLDRIIASCPTIQSGTSHYTSNYLHHFIKKSITRYQALIKWLEVNVVSIDLYLPVYDVYY